jgi:hypothetical protein
MKTILLSISLLLLANLCFSQKKAVTETGEEVILYSDGTWKYVDDSVNEKQAIITNPGIFKKNAGSTFLVKSAQVNVGVWIDPKKWNFKKAIRNEDAEYEFQIKGKELYGMMITEKIEIPIETFEKIAIENARKAAPDIRIVKEEYRTVNDKKILLLQMKGSAEGVKFTYYGYYYSNPKGTVQFLTYTAQNLFDNYLKDIEDFVNGFVVLD